MVKCRLDQVRLESLATREILIPAAIGTAGQRLVRMHQRDLYHHERMSRAVAARGIACRSARIVQHREVDGSKSQDGNEPEQQAGRD